VTKGCIVFPLVLGAMSLPAQAPAAGAGSSACAGFVNSVVPGACLGEFRHGTLVRKTGSGPTGILTLAHSSADASDTHPGVDLVAGCGSPVYSLADGLVIDVISDNNDPDFKYLGYMVRLKHAATPTGLPLPATQMRQAETLYLHFQDPPKVRRGEFIPQHTQLGSVGQTGAAWGCHTHLEVRHFPGRYMSDRSWNFPLNIYGRGDQTTKKLFKESWTDPVQWLTKLPPQVSAPPETTLELAVKSTSQATPEPTGNYIDAGACPGEGCVYNDTWTIEKSISVHPARGASATSFVLTKGQKVRTVTGVVVSTPGKIKIIHPVRVAGQELVRSGYLDVLTYRGEGFWKVWLNGKLIDSVQLQNVFSSITCQSSDTPCMQRAEATLINGPIWGELEAAPKPDWWVQIKDVSGRLGWVDVPSPTWASIHGDF
jgi:murein DD-endopeptidase MepM/ murein hydrolase activator NlpD